MPVSFIDTDEGLAIVFEDGLCGIGIGRYNGLEALKSAPLYMIGTALKFEEAPFSG